MAHRRITVLGEPSFIGTPSGTWAQILAHVTVKPSGSLDVVKVLVERDRVVEVTRGETSRKKLREEFDSMVRELGMRAGPAPGPYVAWRIHRAVADHRAQGGVLTPLADWSVASVPAIADPPPHPALALRPIEDAEARVAESLGLHSEPELRGWLPPKAALDAVGEHVARAKQHPPPPERRIVIPGEPLATPEVPLRDPEALVREAFQVGIDAWFTPEERHRLAVALRDAALAFESSRRHGRALDAVATADAVESAGLWTKRPHDVAFLFGMFYKYMLLHREMTEGRKG